MEKQNCLFDNLDDYIDLGQDENFIDDLFGMKYEDYIREIELEEKELM